MMNLKEKEGPAKLMRTLRDAEPFYMDSEKICKEGLRILTKKISDHPEILEILLKEFKIKKLSDLLTKNYVKCIAKIREIKDEIDENELNEKRKSCKEILGKAIQEMADKGIAHPIVVIELLKTGFESALFPKEETEKHKPTKD